MRGERFVVLGLAHAGSGWFREVARWSTSASLPIEFVKCVSVEELRSRLSTGRSFSAVLVDAHVPGVDRDLVEASRAGGCAALIVDDGRATRDWATLGANAVLPGSFGRSDLLDALAATARPIGRADALVMGEPARSGAGGWRGRLVAVTGIGGAGTSTMAMAIAQGLGTDARSSGLVLLADLALHADQAMLHDVGDIVPGVQELIEAHRGGAPSVAETRALTFTIADRQYGLLLGLRRHRDWASIRPRAFEAALDGLRRCYKTIVTDVTGDVEGEDQCGSIDVEERNLMARAATGAADVVVVVGGAGPRAMHRMVRLVAALLDVGVAAPRIVPVVNRAPRHPRARAELTATLAELTQPLTAGGVPLSPPVHVTERRRLDELIRDAVPLPHALVDPLTAAVSFVLDRTPPEVAPTRQPEPVRVTPGSLGSYADD